MKKFAVSILAVFYLAITTGVIVNKHFCMNRLDSWQLYGTVSDECGRCGMPTGEVHGCCHDEVQVVKLHADQQPSSQIIFHIQAPVAMEAPGIFLYRLPQLAPGTGLPHFLNHSPPLLTSQDIYLKNRVFRI